MSARSVVPIAILCLALAFFVSGQIENNEWRSKVDPEILSKLDSVISPLSDEVVIIVKHTSAHALSGIEHDALENVPWSTAKIPLHSVPGLARNPNVEFIELSKPVRLLLQQSRPLIGADSAVNQQINSVNITGKNVGVCVVDTGVNYTHPDLGGGFGLQFKVKGGYDFSNEDSDPMDDNGHGTHVAGTVAANGSISGVAPEASIIAMKVLDSNGDGTFADVDRALDWCISNASIFNISVITMSIGTSSPFIYSSACDGDFNSTAALVNVAVSKNITVIAASGNDGSTTRISAPACISNITAVAAVYDSGPSVDQVTSFSNRNSLVSIVAPGSVINSTDFSGGYSLKSGTSMAAPHYAGAVALYVQKYQLVYNSSPITRTVLSEFSSTGKKVNDSGRNFSRINLTSVLDWSVSSVNLDLPRNDSIVSGNYTVKASLYSGLGENASFYFSNSSGSFLACLNTTRGRIFSCIWNTAQAGELLVNFSVNVSNVSATVSNVSSNITIDNVFPSFSDNQTNQSMTFVGDSVWFSALWNDTNLDSAVLYMFENGSQRNLTYKFNGTNVSNITWSNSTLRAGHIINWSIWANDTAGNLNSSMPLNSFVLWGRSNLSNYTNSPASPNSDDTVQLKCKVTDEFSNAVKNYPVNFTVENQTFTNYTGSDGFAILHRTFSPGEYTVRCDITANATMYYNSTFTNTTSWNITVVSPPTPPSPPSPGGGSSGGGSSGGGNSIAQPQTQVQQNSTLKETNKTLSEDTSKKVEFNLRISDLERKVSETDQLDRLADAKRLSNSGDYEGALKIIESVESELQSQKSITGQSVQTSLNPLWVVGVILLIAAFAVVVYLRRRFV